MTPTPTDPNLSDMERTAQTLTAVRGLDHTKDEELGAWEEADDAFSDMFTAELVLYLLNRLKLAEAEQKGAGGLSWHEIALAAEARAQALEQELGRMRDRYHASVEMGMEQQTRAQTAESALVLAEEAQEPFRWIAKNEMSAHPQTDDMESVMVAFKHVSRASQAAAAIAQVKP